MKAELDLFHPGESPDYDLMLDIMFYMKKEEERYAALRRQIAREARRTVKITRW
jgi:hypothetical protein